MGMRISGMATGMDINQMVSDLMRANRVPVDKLMQQRQVIQWQMDGYREINRKFNTFRDNIFDTVMRQSNMLSKSVSSSNSSLVTATAASNSSIGTIRISNVQSLATAASNVSSAVVSNGDKLNASTALGSQNLNADFTWSKGVVHKETVQGAAGEDKISVAKTNLIDTANMVVKVGSKVYQVTTDPAATLDDNTVFVDTAAGDIKFNSPFATGTSVSVTYMTNNDTQSFTGDPRQTFQLAKGGLEASTLSVKVAGVEYTVVTDRSELNSTSVLVNMETGLLEFDSAKTDVVVDFQQRYTAGGVQAFNENGPVEDKFVFTANQSLNAMFNELSRSSVGIAGFYDQHGDKVSLTRNQTGKFNPDAAGKEMTFSGAFFTDALKINNANEQAAQNAVFTINGLATERTSNTFTVDGVTITLKDTFASDVTLSASTDTDKVFDTIKKFVDEYNEILDFVNGKLQEERYRDYPPLTDEQRDSLSEKEIERWEERAQSGMLRNDQLLQSFMNQLRTDIYNSVSSSLATEFRQLSTIGITTSPDYNERGKLVIDEDKLRQAIEQDAEGVYQLFTASGEGAANQGIARRVRDTLDSAINTISDRAGGMRGRTQNHQFTLGRNINDLNDRITNFERRLQQLEERYWRQFTAMETAVQRANSQAESLFAQLYGNQGM
ncbi:flagellar filament capping protein FliD [Halalkalibacterium ligniniphilum]|uniref:flagellar filament capping protein FliD n=1 Tax=Halalkalibacterium ligniniphilum TaxID=1134413 RepID=UPI000348A81C|nr:flagellar filament capping protein FliD [Halalkalibacterium ligniniphilum]